MKKVGILLMFSLCTSLAQAELFESRNADGNLAYSDRVDRPFVATRHDRAITNKLEAEQFPGVWLAHSGDGLASELTLRSDGSFVFNQSNDTSAHRVYMCGTWDNQEKALALTVQAFKRRLANGETEQTAEPFQSRANIMSARRDRIILLIEGEQLVFDRRG